MTTQVLISGAGDIGFRVLRRLLQSGLYPKLQAASVVAETKTTQRAALYEELGIAHKSTQQAPLSADSVLISFPPSNTYLEDVKKSLLQWNKSGQCVLISSTSVYEENEGHLIDERAKIKKDSLQAQAEKLALDAGAHVLRLAGLYTLDSGPHAFWQTQGEVKSSPSSYINLIHRHDAANAIARLLMSKLKPDVWHLSDAHPLRRFDIAERWAKYGRVKAAKFVDLEDPSLGKKIDPSKFFKALDWFPRFKSFLEFVDSLEHPRNILGSPLKSCCTQPMTGFVRNGFCTPHPDDPGFHIICVEMTEKFLAFSKEKGNDLSTPRPDFHFTGLRPGDKWCLVAARWLEALASNMAPRIYAECTHEAMIEWVEPEVLRRYALDLA